MVSVLSERQRVDGDERTDPSVDLDTLLEVPDISRVAGLARSDRQKDGARQLSTRQHRVSEQGIQINSRVKGAHTLRGVL